MKRIFEKSHIKGLTLKNRLVRSATWEGLAGGDGAVTEELITFYRQLAQGGVGLIISSYLYVRSDGKQHNTQIGVDHDGQIEGLKRLADAVHEACGVIVGQIVHCGGQARREAISGGSPLAPSALSTPGYPESPQELGLKDIEDLIVAFAEAAARLKKAGFDGVQLHGAHGYLLSQFISPLRNRRQDQYGQDRTLFTRKVYRAVREAVGEEFPVMIKMNMDDFMEGATSRDDAVNLARRLAEDGIDAIEVSGGTPGSEGNRGPVRTKIVHQKDEGYFFEEARYLRSQLPQIPLILVGGLRSIEKSELLLASEVVDYLSFSRPLICEPDLPNRWKDGDRDKAACLSCNGCFKPAFEGRGLRCLVKPGRYYNG